MFALARRAQPGSAEATSKAAPHARPPQRAPVNPTWLRLVTTTPATAGTAGPIQRKCGACEAKEKAAPGVSSPGDASEREADAAADRVMRMATPEALGAGPVHLQRKCAGCEEEQKNQIQTRRAGPGDGGKGMDPGTAARVAERGGAPLSREARAFFEPRFGRDFSQVRVHTDGGAAEGARAVQARAYTMGRDIVFGTGQYAPDTEDGKRLLAHELSHVVQQGGGAGERSIQRCPDAATDAQYDTKAAAVKSHAVYTGLAGAAKTNADKIITDGKPKNNCVYYIDKLKLLFDTPEATAAESTTMWEGETKTAAAAETARLGTDAGKERKGVEEQAAKAATFTKKPGKYSVGTPPRPMPNYEIDARDPLNIAVRAKVLLTKAGTGTDAQVAAIKGMEDGIEKHASTRGYQVDIDFPTVADADTFQVNVDASEWETATNWSGGEAKGFAHELHHMLAFELDRYDYIESHSANKHMKIKDRLHWFVQEMSKAAGYNTADSIMNSADNPSDDDVCRTAGLNVATCVASRQKVSKMYTDITAAHKTPDERILNCISKHYKKDQATTVAVLRELFRQLVGSKTDRDRIVKRAKDGTDTFGQVFKQMTSVEQTELLAIVPPP